MFTLCVSVGPALNALKLKLMIYLSFDHLFLINTDVLFVKINK